MTIQRDLFSVSLTEKIKTVCDYKKLVYVYCFKPTPDCLSGSCCYFIQSKKTEFLSGVYVELKSPEARKSQREKRHTKKPKEIIFPIYSVQTLYDLANIIEVIIEKQGQEEKTVTQQQKSIRVWICS